MNILQTEDLIKGLPDDRLMQEAKNPTGQVPQFLVVSEIQRRSTMRKKYSEQPEGTVADQIISEAGQSPQRPPQEVQQQPDPNQQSQQMGPPQGPPQGPQQQMNQGGIIRLASGGTITLPMGGTNYTIGMDGYPNQQSAIEAFFSGRNPPVDQGYQEYGVSSLDEPFDFQMPDPVNDALASVGFEAPPEQSEPESGGGGIMEIAVADEIKEPDKQEFSPPDNPNMFEGTDQHSTAEGRQVQGNKGLADLLANQRKSTFGSALMQVGAGIASNRLGQGISRAATTIAQGNQFANQLEVRAMLAQMQADSATPPETFRNATAAELAGRPEGTTGQISNRSQKLTNVWTPPVTSADPKAVEIQRYMNLYPGLLEADATAVAYGVMDINTDTLGVTHLQNPLDGTDKIIEQRSAPMMSVETPVEQTLYGSADEGTGLWNAGVRAAARVASVAGADIGFAEDEIRAEQLMESTSRTVKQGFMLSDKYAVREQEMILKALPLLASWRTEPEVYRQTSISIDGYLSRSIAQAEIDLRESPDPVVKRQAKRVAGDMRSLLNALGIPKGKREDARSWAMAQKGFFDMPMDQQEEYVQLVLAEQTQLRGQ